MKKIVALALGLITTFTVCAQENKKKEKEEFDNITKNQGIERQTSALAENGLLSQSFIPASDIAGSKFYNDAWDSAALVQVKGGKTFGLEKVNFDRERGIFMVELENNELYDLSSGDLEMINFEGRMFKRFVNPQTNSFRYMEVLYSSEGKTLLKDYDVIIRQGKFSPTKGQEPDAFVAVERYFYVENNSFSKFKLNKSSVMRIFENKEEEMKRFIKENKLSIKDESDLLKIFNHYKSIANS